MKPTYRKSWAGNLLMWSDLILDHSFRQMRIAKLKLLITCLLLVLEVCNVKPTYKKSWASSRSNDGLLALVSCLPGG